MCCVFFSDILSPCIFPSASFPFSLAWGWGRDGIDWNWTRLAEQRHDTQEARGHKAKYTRRRRPNARCITDITLHSSRIKALKAVRSKSYNSSLSAQSTIPSKSTTRGSKSDQASSASTLHKISSRKPSSTPSTPSPILTGATPSQWSISRNRRDTLVMHLRICSWAWRLRRRSCCCCSEVGVGAAAICLLRRESW